MWTAWATEIAMTMMGTPELTGLKTVRNQPANPMVVAMTKAIMTTMTPVPSSDRRSMVEAITMRPNTIGRSVSRSSCVASAKARFMTTSPVRKKSIPALAARASASMVSR